MDEAPWPGRSKAMMRWVEVRDGDAKICFQILDDEELPWMSRRVGRSFLSAVSVTLIRPCGVSSVNEPLDMVGVFGSGDQAGSIP